MGVSCWRGGRLRPQFPDQPQNLLEHLPWNGDLGHLECDVAAVADDFAPILISFSFRLVSDQPLIGSVVFFAASRQQPMPKTAPISNVCKRRMTAVLLTLVRWGTGPHVTMKLTLMC